jgi:hypothetical protein
MHTAKKKEKENPAKFNSESAGSTTTNGHTRTAN